VLDHCPGKQGLKHLDSLLIPCPECGRLVEFFTDEPQRLCPCGHVLRRETLPPCAAWCAAASSCLGHPLDLAALEQRIAQVKNDPRAKQCLEIIRARLQRRQDERAEN